MESIRKCFQRRSLPLRDELILSSWEKWKKYHRFPWKLSVDVIIFVLAVTVTVLVSLQSSSYDNGCQTTFANLFGSSNLKPITNEADFLGQIQKLVTNFYNIKNVSLARFYHVRDPYSLEIDPVPIMTLFEFAGYGSFDFNRSTFVLPPNFDVRKSVYKLPEDDPLGPFSDDGGLDLTLLQKLSSLQIDFSLISLNVGPLGAIPYQWKISAIFDLIPGSGIANFRLQVNLEY